jgi:hypothetical protein
VGGERLAAIVPRRRMCLCRLFHAYVTLCLRACSVIAIIKDVPDVGGDREYQIKTLSVRLGAHTVFPQPHPANPLPTFHTHRRTLCP